MSEWENQLYFGDNLEIMREHIPDESVDLIYLDPPFKSDQNYNVIFKERNGSNSRAQITAFEDTWHWGIESEKEYLELVETGPKKVADLMQSMRGFLGTNDMMAYLVMMALRLLEMKRILKETGSIYLHCDPTASHYLKLLMDAVFSAERFQNEIIWYYRRWTNVSGKFQRMHDIILFFTKSDVYKFNTLYQPYSEKTIHRKLSVDGITNLEEKRDIKKGIVMHDVWELPYLHSQSKERLGYPTQKPEELLERIIKASSDERETVLDPFCGCGTTITVAEKLKRRWIGIDITHLAISLMRYRLEDTFGPELSPYEVIGAPKDLRSAESLAKGDRTEFERWAVGMIKAMPYKPKGADAGIDGYIYFHDDTSGKAKEIIIQVKSGHVGPSHIRDLKGVLEREKAQIGAFITLQEPTREMIKEAATSGFYESKEVGKSYPRLQILTIKDLLNNVVKLEYPGSIKDVTFKQAERKTKEGKPGELF